QTEMGGKNVVIVARDADLDAAAALTASGAMRYAGQKCTATSRVVMAREIEHEFLSKLRAQVEALPLGPVDDPASAVGPLISDAARERVKNTMADAAPERLFGGDMPADDRLAHGFFMAPTVIRYRDAGEPLAQRELRSEHHGGRRARATVRWRHAGGRPARPRILHGAHRDSLSRRRRATRPARTPIGTPWRTPRPSDCSVETCRRTTGSPTDSSWRPP